MTTARTTTLSEADLDLIERIHGHLCPMVLLGSRTARVARFSSSAHDAGSNLFGFYRGYGCAVDGIQLFSGCTWGNQNLVLLRGKNFSFILTPEGAEHGIMVWPGQRLLERIREERTPQSRSALMEMFISAPHEEFLEVRAVTDMGSFSEFPGD